MRSSSDRAGGRCDVDAKLLGCMALAGTAMSCSRDHYRTDARQGGHPAGHGEVERPALGLTDFTIDWTRAAATTIRAIRTILPCRPTIRHPTSIMEEVDGIKGSAPWDIIRSRQPSSRTPSGGSTWAKGWSRPRTASSSSGSRMPSGWRIVHSPSYQQQLETHLSLRSRRQHRAIPLRRPVLRGLTGCRGAPRKREPGRREQHRRGRPATGA